MIEFVVESFISIFECFITLYFITQFLDSKFESRRKIALFVFVLALDIVYALYRDNFLFNEGYLTYIHIFAYFIYAIFCLKGSLSKKLFVSILPSFSGMLINVIIPSTISIIVNVPIYDFANNFGVLRVTTLLLTKLCLLLICWLFLYLQKQLKHDLSNSQYGYLSFLQVLSTCLLSFIIDNTVFVAGKDFNNVLYISTYVGVGACNILFYVLMNRINNLNYQRSQNLLLNQQNEYQQEYVSRAISVYEKAKSLKHDLKNHFTTLSILIEDNKNSDASEYINTVISNHINELVIMVDSNNNAINALISSKMSLCKRENIDLICNIGADLSDVPSMDICTIIANALDNAIEASKNMSHNKIELHIQRLKNYLSITVKNRIETSVLDINPNLQTTKKDASFHGIGTKNIKVIVNKYDGSVEYYEKDNYFFCNALLRIF